jgi:hypothetical protein
MSVGGPASETIACLRRWMSSRGDLGREPCNGDEQTDHGVMDLLKTDDSLCALAWAALIPLVQQAIECYRLRQEVAELRRTLLESGLKLDCVMRSLVAGTHEAFQPPLPY